MRQIIQESQSSSNHFGIWIPNRDANFMTAAVERPIAFDISSVDFNRGNLPPARVMRRSRR
jgi:hypothetical protein